MNIRADKLIYADKIRLYAFERGRGNMAYATNLVMQTADEGTMIDPFVHISYEEAQALMDSLWECGLRPSEGSGSAGALAATQRHLEDMRRLVFTDNKPPLAANK